MSATCPRCGAETETRWHTHEGCINRQLSNAKAALEELREAARAIAEHFPPTGKYGDADIRAKLKRLRALLAQGEDRLPSAKEVLAGRAPMPEGVSPEELPAGMRGDRGDPLEGVNGYHGEGWVRVTPMDRPGRRALWFRTPASIAELRAKTDEELVAAMSQPSHPLEIRAGREGDDTHFVLEVGMVLDSGKIAELVDALERGRAYIEDP